MRASSCAAALAAALAAGPAAADTVIALRTLRAQTLIEPADVGLEPGIVSGAANRLEDVIGREARVAIYKGRPVLDGDTTAPTLVERNQVVPLLFVAGPLVIAAEGRALERGGRGDQIRIMNTASRTTVTGMVMADGSVAVRSTR